MVKKKEFDPKVQWAKFIGVLVLYLLFLFQAWMQFEAEKQFSAAVAEVSKEAGSITG